MNRTELVDAIAERTGVSKSDVDASIKGLFDVVAGVVAKGGEKVTIPGWISFEQGARSARTGRNPQTGAEIKIAATKVPGFKAGAQFKNAVAG